GHLALVALLTRELGQRLGVVELLLEALIELDVGRDRGQLASDLLGELLVVPEVGARRFGLQLRSPVARVVDAELLLRLVQSLPDRPEVVTEITHVVASAPVAHLELLAAAARARRIAGRLVPLALADGDVHDLFVGLRRWRLRGPAAFDR